MSLRNFRTQLHNNQGRHSRVDIPRTCKVGQTWSVSPSVDMLPFGLTFPATAPQRSKIPEGLMNYPVYNGLDYTFDLASCLLFPCSLKHM